MVGKTNSLHSKTVFRLIIIFIVLLLSPIASTQEINETRIQNSIELKSDTRELFAGDVLVIDIESIGLIEPLDITPLFRHGEFLRETTGTLISVVKGKVVEIAVRRVEISPRTEGVFVFGPLEGETIQGKVTSNAITVQVAPEPINDWVPEPDDITISATVNKATPYIGEQFQLDIVLSHQYALAAESFTLPNLDGFDVTPVYEARRLMNNETDMRTTQWRYLLHAQRSGLQTLQGPSWSATLIRSRTQRFDFSLNHEPITIDTAARPNNFPSGAWWLAAESVSLSDSWSETLIELSAGDEIIRTIELSVNGVLANHLPVITPLATRSFHSTPLPVQRSDELIGEQTSATGLYQFRMIAESPVSVFLDTVRVPWFNTKTKQIEEAIIPARRVNISLPKRPDQLAELAIERHKISRLKLWLRSISVSQWAAVTVALTGLILLLSWLYHQEFATTKRTLNLFFTRNQWRFWKVTKQWTKLYDAMLRKQSPFANLPVMDELKTEIGKHLFAGSSLGNEIQQLSNSRQFNKNWKLFVKSGYSSLETHNTGNDSSNNSSKQEHSTRYQSKQNHSLMNSDMPL